MEARAQNTGMILHAAKFSDRLNCMISLPDRRRPQTGKIDCWSADIVRAYGIGDERRLALDGGRAAKGSEDIRAISSGLS